MVGGRRHRPGDHLSGALALLRRRRQFRSLWSALALSYVGSGAATVALVLYVQQTRGTGTAVAALLVAEGAPRLLGPLAGGLADRIDLRQMMIGADLGQAALFALMALLPPFAILLALSALTSLLQTAYSPARTSAVPVLVEEDELLTANALTGAASNLYVAIGPLVGALLFVAGGASLVLVINAVSFIGSAQLTRGIPSLPPPPRGDGDENFLAAVRTALRFAMADRLTRTVMLSIFAVFAFIAVDNVALVFLVRDTLGASAGAYGIVSAVFGIGMLTASLAIASGTTLPAPLLYLLSLLLSSVGTLLTGIAPVIAVVALFQLVAGSGNGMEIVASETILHQRVPRHLLGRVAGLLTTAIAAGLAVAMAAGGLLVDATSPRFVLIAAGAGCLIVTAAAAPTLLAARQG
ncbi:MAG: MFS transporter [Solirubrobacterales bacterium]|nr:MFS transporter [Solirubrobacterales bacterium]